MQTGSTVMDREVPVKLSEHEIAERAEIMSAKLLRVKVLKRKRREMFKDYTAQIDSELEEAMRLARVVAEGIEARKQGDLRFGDAVVPSTSEAAVALAEIDKHRAPREPEYHKNGELCRRDVCKRRHLTAEQCRASGIVVEGDPLVPEGEAAKPAVAVGSPCPGCEKPLESAMEAVKGLCETCQTSKGGDPLEGTPQAAAVDELAADITAAGIEGVIAEDDPRPRCSTGGEVLNADEVEKGIGMCQACIDAAGGTDKPEPDTEEAPAAGGEAGAA